MQATCHRASREAKDEVCSLSCSGGRFDIQSERECCHCSGEFEQLLLTYIEGCGLRSDTNTFEEVGAAACTLYLVTVDIELGR